MIRVHRRSIPPQCSVTFSSCLVFSCVFPAHLGSGCYIVPRFCVVNKTSVVVVTIHGWRMPSDLWWGKGGSYSVTWRLQGRRQTLTHAGTWHRTGIPCRGTEFDPQIVCITNTHVHFQNDVNFLKFPNLAVCVPAGYWLSSQIWRWLLMASLISTTSNCSSIYNCWDMSTVFKRWTNFIYLTDIQPWLTNKCFLQSQCWHLIMKWLWSYLHLLGNFDLSSQEFTFYSKWLFVNVFDEHYMFLVLTLYNWEMA